MEAIFYLFILINWFIYLFSKCVTSVILWFKQNKLFSLHEILFTIFETLKV